LAALGSVACATGSAQPRTLADNAPNCARFDKGARAADIGLERAVLVKRVQGERQYAKLAMRYTSGVELFVPAQGAVSQQFLQHALECRAAEYATARAPLDETDLFALPGVQTRVMAGTNGHLVRVTSDDRDTARELVARAEQTYGRVATR
jgi:hypothetical protein